MELTGWNLRIVCYRIGGQYLAEIKAVESGATIARATGEQRGRAEAEAIDAALKHLRRTRRVDFDLTVGG